MSWLTGILAALYLACLVGLFLYGVNCYLLILLHRRHRREAREADARIQAEGRAWLEATLPVVTVQLPIFNERYVVERLLRAVTRLDYPRDRLEIQVLDDSTDDTREIAARLVEGYRAAGMDVVRLHRPVREGYKAGALKDGLAVCRGEFVAIFDADFVPDPDFLRRTLPYFRDPGVGVVQTRWGHMNRDYSLLTTGQALGIDGHFGVEQGSRAWGGLYLNFNGTAGIWRKAAILDAGGWQADTLTEDLDLSYRAQLCGWRLVFLADVVCPAELPVQIQGFKSQQQRWAKGSIQTARKLIPAILRAPGSAFKKYQAVIHLTHYAVHPLMLMVAIASPILLYLEWYFASWQSVFAAAAFFCLATFGPSALYCYSQRTLYPDWRKRLPYLPSLMLLGTGIALSNSQAVLEGLFHRAGDFIRTPKFAIQGREDSWKSKRYRSRFSWTAVGEILLAIYSGIGVYLFLDRGRILIGPFLVLYTLGFAYVGVLTVLHSMEGRRAGSGRVNIWKEPADVSEV
ncbi:MAG: glycosyltransferase [candidate division NC10 bacterium]|nr:glycosyltransferase [candidate division NC10 bacterium]MBI4840488.1 glycosyltransferase [candidate division NC10 bacterium]